jgi:hypothetical protein
MCPPPYYVDVTHPDANKGAVVRYLSATYAIPPDAIATISDMPNDALMFAHSGLSIAMGNASLEVQCPARRVTTSNADEGFASAVDRVHPPLGCRSPRTSPSMSIGALLTMSEFPVFGLAGRDMDQQARLRDSRTSIPRCPWSGGRPATGRR